MFAIKSLSNSAISQKPDPLSEPVNNTFRDCYLVHINPNLILLDLTRIWILIACRHTEWKADEVILSIYYPGFYGLFRHAIVISCGRSGISRYPGKHQQRKKPGTHRAGNVTPAGIGWRRYGLFKKAKVKKTTRRPKLIKQIVETSSSYSLRPSGQ